VPSHTWGFSAPAGKLTFTVAWEPGRVTMSTRSGSRVAASHVFAPQVPTPGSESMRINLYAYSGLRAPPLQHGSEVVVDNFSYLP
jgi:hypothetical protein